MKRLQVLLILLVLLILSPGVDARSRPGNTPLIGSVQTYHAVEQTEGWNAVVLPPGYETGYFFLTSESGVSENAVVVNGYIEQGTLAIQSTYIDSPNTASIITINYMVYPD